MSFFSKLGEFGRGLVEGAPAGIQAGVSIHRGRRQEARLQRGEVRTDEAAAQRKREELRRDFGRLTSAQDRTAFVTRLESTRDPSLTQLVNEFKAQIQEQKRTEQRGITETGQRLLTGAEEVAAGAAPRPIPTTGAGRIERLRELRGTATAALGIQAGTFTAMGEAEGLGLDTTRNLSAATDAYARAVEIEFGAIDKAKAIESTEAAVANAVTLGELDRDTEGRLRTLLGRAFSNDQVDNFIISINAMVRKTASDQVMQIASVPGGLAEIGKNPDLIDKILGITQRELISSLATTALDHVNNAEAKRKFDLNWGMFTAAIKSQDLDGAEKVIPALAANSPVQDIENILKRYAKYMTASIRRSDKDKALWDVGVGILEMDVRQPGFRGLQDLASGLTNLERLINTGEGRELDVRDAVDLIGEVNKAVGGAARNEMATRKFEDLNTGLGIDLTQKQKDAFIAIVLEEAQKEASFSPEITRIWGGVEAEPAAPPPPPGSRAAKAQAIYSGVGTLLGGAGEALGKTAARVGQGTRPSRFRGRGGRSGLRAALSATNPFPRIPLEEISPSDRQDMKRQLEAAGVTPSEMRTMTLPEIRRRLDSSNLGNTVRATAAADTNTIIGGP